MEERDGPTLLHTLQGVHGEKILLPRHRGALPDPVLLEERFERFRLGRLSKRRTLTLCRSTNTNAETAGTSSSGSAR